MEKRREIVIIQIRKYALSSRRNLTGLFEGNLAHITRLKICIKLLPFYNYYPRIHKYASSKPPKLANSIKEKV